MAGGRFNKQELRSLVAEAVRLEGADPAYVDIITAKANMEAARSGSDYLASSGNGKYQGLYQFDQPTWDSVGMGGADRNDPLANARAAIRLAERNAKILKSAGLPVTATTLYFCHQLGSGGGPHFLKGVKANPDVEPEDFRFMGYSGSVMANSNPSIYKFEKVTKRPIDSIGQAFVQLARDVFHDKAALEWFEKATGRSVNSQSVRGYGAGENILGTVDVSYVASPKVEEKLSDRPLDFGDGMPGKKVFKSRVEEMQYNLLVVGNQCGDWGDKGNGVDGKFGRDTKAALIAYQKEQIKEGNLKASEIKIGVFDKKTQELLSAQAEEKAAQRGDDVAQGTKTTKVNLSREDVSAPWQTLNFENEKTINGYAQNMVKALTRNDYAEFNLLLASLPTNVDVKDNKVSVKYGSPLPGSVVTSGVGERDTGIQGASKNHQAIDLDVNYEGKNIKVMSAAPGVVIFAGNKGGLGNTIEIRHADGNVTKYSHLASIDSAVKVGEEVKGGTDIGVMGDTGISGNAHLHFAMEDINGKILNPLSYIDPKANAYKGVQLTEEQVESAVLLTAMLMQTQRNKTFNSYIASQAEKSPQERDRETRYAMLSDTEVQSPANLPRVPAGKNRAATAGV